MRGVRLPAIRPDGFCTCGPTYPRTWFLEPVGGPRMRKSRTITGNRPLTVGAAVAVAAAAVLASPALPAFAGATLTLSPSQVNSAGGTVVYITGGTTLADDLGVRFVPTGTTCPTNYG